MSKSDLKFKLDNQAYEKLREVIKKKTSFENINEENIKTIKEAVNILTTWLEEVYALDSQDVEINDGGFDIDKLFVVKGDN